MKEVRVVCNILVPNAVQDEAYRIDRIEPNQLHWGFQIVGRQTL